MDLNFYGATEKILGFLAEPRTGMEIPPLDEFTPAQQSLDTLSRVYEHTPLLAHSRVCHCTLLANVVVSPEVTPLVCPPVTEVQFLFSCKED